MDSACISRILRMTMTGIVMLAGVIVLILMYFKSLPLTQCHPPPAHSRRPAKQVNIHAASTPQQPNSSAASQPTDKPVMLLWFWPENKTFDFQDCKKLFNIDSCHITDDRSLYPKAKAVLIFHKAIQDDLSNLPPSPRSRLQRWIWFNMDSPTNTRRIPGIQDLFNLTLSYRMDADICARWKLTLKENTEGDFVLPKKERLLCWIVDRDNLQMNPGERFDYYWQLAKHIEVEMFDSTDFVDDEDYFLTISSCKFYLSFEDSTHTDFITETFNGPLAAGTVPIALGPPRKNYEDLAPGTSFIHVNDFPDAATLARFLLSLDKDNKAYMRFFNWRQFHTARRHFNEKHKFAHAICQACHYVAMNKEYRVIPDLYKWLSE